MNQFGASGLEAGGGVADGLSAGANTLRPSHSASGKSRTNLQRYRSGSRFWYWLKAAVWPDRKPFGSAKKSAILLIGEVEQ
jgi:hypothetical protein